MSPRYPWERSKTSSRTRKAQKPVDTREYRQALEVLNRMREGWSLTEAARAVGITPRTVQRYVGTALERDDDGRWQPKANDRLHRRMWFIDERGSYVVEPADAREASKLGAYANAVREYLYHDKDHELRQFRHQRLRTRQKTSLPFVTD
jgi:hypothetical protein